MKLGSGVLGAIALGAGFGAATALSYGLGSPSEPHSFARVVSLVVDAPWAWAGLAVVAGWRVAEPLRGAVAGVLALSAATTAYYGAHSIAQQESLGLYWPQMHRWWLVGVVCGSALGAVGAFGARPGAPGLPARLVIPLGATLQMIVLPPGTGGAFVSPAERWVRLTVVATSGACAAAVIARFSLLERQRRKLTAARYGIACVKE